MDILLRTGDDGANLVKNMDDVTLNRMFTINVGGAPYRRLLEFRVGLVQMKRINRSNEEIVKSTTWQIY